MICCLVNIHMLIDVCAYQLSWSAQCCLLTSTLVIQYMHNVSCVFTTSCTYRLLANGGDPQIAAAITDFTPQTHRFTTFRGDLQQWLLWAFLSSICTHIHMSVEVIYAVSDIFSDMNFSPNTFRGDLQQWLMWAFLYEYTHTHMYAHTDILIWHNIFLKSVWCWYFWVYK